MSGGAGDRVDPGLRVALDLQALQVEGIADRGIGRYAANLAAALGRTGRLAAALLAPELPPAAGLPAEVAATGLVAWDSATTLRRLRRETGDRLVHHVVAAFVHVGATDPSVLVTSPHWARAGCPRVVTLHDLIPLRAPLHYLSAPGAAERYQARARWVAASDLILANSAHTGDEAVAVLGCDPGRVVDVGAGVTPWWSPPDGTDEALFASVLDRWRARPFALCVAGSDSRKNVERLIEAVGILARRGEGIGLVVAGHLTPAWTERLRSAAAAAGVAERVELAGAVDDEVLRACYRRAVVTVMPSLAEGSGLPVLESAACATPAVASATTSLGEVAATPLATFDPTDAGSIADAIARVTTDDAVRSAVLAAQAALVATSTWDAVARRGLAAIDRLLPVGPGRSGSGSGPARAGVGVGVGVGVGAMTSDPGPLEALLVGPVLPSGGGIGAYNTRLLATAGGAVRWSVATEHDLPPELSETCSRVHPRLVGLDVRPASYDSVVYTVGNSAGHLGRVQLALRHPGWLWLHEVRLPSLATTALAHLSDTDFADSLRRLLDRAYPDRSPWPAASRAGRSAAALADAGVGLAGLLATRARGVLVNSEAARRLLELDLPPGVAAPPIHVLPAMCPPVAPGAEPRPGGGAGLVAFGIVSMHKQPDVLVDAAALLGCRLTFVGPCPPILRQVITERAEVRGTLGAVEVVGEVDRTGWDDWLERSTVAVQLRRGAAGETSAALLDALAAGTPAATSLLSTSGPADGPLQVDSSSAEALAEGLGPFLASAAARSAASAAGLAFARAHQPDRLGAALLEVLAS